MYVVVQSLSCVPMDCSTPGFSVLHYLLHVHWVGDDIQPSHPLLSPSPPAFNLSQNQGSFLMSWLFASGGQSIEASASASVLPMNGQGWFPLGLIGLISLLSKGLLKSLLQHHSSEGSILWHLAFFMVQLSYPYMDTGKTTALTIRTFIRKVQNKVTKDYGCLGNKNWWMLCVS